MKNYYTLIIFLCISVTLSAQKFELTYDVPPEGMEVLLGYPSHYKYDWSCDGQWLFFWTIGKKVELDLGSMEFGTDIYVAGPFNENAKIISVKKLEISRLTNILISPDQKKLFVEKKGIWDEIRYGIYEFNDVITPFNDCKLIFNDYNLKFGTQTFDNFIWSPSSNEIFNKFYPTFYSLSLKKVLRIDKPITNKEKDIHKERIMRIHDLNIEKAWKYSLRGIKYKLRMSDENLFARVVNIDHLYIKKGDKKYFDNISNPYRNKIYVFNKYNAVWEPSDFFPSDVYCKPKTRVSIKFEKLDASSTSVVKGEWGQTTVKRNNVIKKYKLTIQKY